MHLRNLTLLFSLILLSACSKQEQVDPKQKVTLTITREGLSAAGDGGVMIWGKNSSKDRILAIALPSGQTAATFELDTGVWDFAGMAWDGPNELEGGANCFILTGREISGDEASVNINLTDSNACENNSATNQAAFYNQGTSSIDGSGQWTPIHITSCVDFTDVTSTPAANTTCSDAQESGDFRSYKIVLLTQPAFGGPPSPGLVGACHQTNEVSSLVLDQSANLTRIPLGTGQFAIPTRIEAYKDTGCTSGGENFDFPDGLSQPGFNFSSIFHSSVSYTNDRPLIVLPGAAGPGGGSSPLTSILPTWECDGAYQATYCGPDETETFGNFHYLIPFAPGEDVLLFLDETDDTAGDCTFSISGGDVSVNSSCDCDLNQCFQFINQSGGPTGCNGNSYCAYGEVTDGTEANVTYLGGSNNSIFIADEVGYTLMAAREIFYETFGTEDGGAFELENRFSPYNSDYDNNLGFLGEMREFLGPGELGGILAQQGFQNCNEIGTSTFPTAFSDSFTNGGGGTTNVDVVVSNGLLPIPNDLLGSVNSSNIPFQKRVKLTINETESDGDTRFENIILEFNCPGAATGDFVGAILAREEENNMMDGEEYRYTERWALFYNTSDQTNKIVERVEISEDFNLDADPSDQLDEKYWSWGRVQNEAGIQNAMQAGMTVVELGRDEGPDSDLVYTQFRGAFTLHAGTGGSQKRYAIAGEFTEAADPVNYSDDSASAATSGFVPADQVCVHLDTLLKNGSGASCSDSDIVDMGAENPMFIQILGQTKNTSMNFIGKPINCTGDPEIPSSEMECLLEQLLVNSGI